MVIVKHRRVILELFIAKVNCGWSYEKNMARVYKSIMYVYKHASGAVLFCQKQLLNGSCKAFRR
jgi:hypothetical protein